MPIGERFRGGGTRGIARFLADHQHCDAGFDVRRVDEPGSGKLRITCEGCGQTVSYRAADAVDLAAGGTGVTTGTNGGPALEVSPPVAEPRRSPPPGPTPPGPIPRTAKPPERPPDRPVPGRIGFGLPGWAPAALIALLIAGGLGMIVAGLLRSDDDGDAAPAAEAPAQEAPTEPQPTEPAPTTPPEEEPAPEDEPAPGDDAVAAVELDRERVADTFFIGVPDGWERNEEDGGVSIEARGGEAEIRVFFERGERPNGELARAAAGFLADEHPGAQVSAPENERFGGERGALVRSEYPGGEEEALVLSDKGNAFLVLCRRDRGASDQVELEAEAIMASFEAA
jgi:hypothetical protein